jgi:ribosomal protein S18 acetylase RimI-like enzyme
VTSGTSQAGTSGRRARWHVTTGTQDPAAVERLLAALPTWFGIESSNRAYVADAHELPTFLARPAGAPDAQPAGVLLARRHFHESAEIHLLAVAPELHRQGAGRALVAALAADLVADGCELLQVKTQGPSRPDEGYTRTRLFYASLGFRPLEERTDIWGPDNPCLFMVMPLAQWAGA